MKTLTTLQNEIIKILKKHEWWKYLSFRKLWEMLWWVHHQTITNNIKQLVNRWFLREQEDWEYIILDNPISDVVRIPVYWSAQCGNQWSEIAEERPVDYISYSTKVLGVSNADDFIFVKAKGNSMEPDIHAWDLLLIRKWKWWFNEWDKLLLIHNGKPKIKQVICSNWKYLLISLNKEHKNVEILQEDDVDIVWIVKKVIKDF